MCVLTRELPTQGTTISRDITRELIKQQIHDFYNIAYQRVFLKSEMKDPTFNTHKD